MHELHGKEHANQMDAVIYVGSSLIISQGTYQNLKIMFCDSNIE